MKNLPVTIVWAVAFAFVEAAVVEYLRALYYPLGRGGFLFPLLTSQQLGAMGEEHARRLLIEVGREAGTLSMLAAVGMLAGANRPQAWAHFMIAFGIWDIFFYLWLKLFLDWPASLMTWDLLFLIPVPWVSPVLAPVLVSLTMIGCGVVILWYEYKGTPLVASWTDWVFFTLGGATVILSFCWDFRNVMAGGVPGHFQWPMFLVGLGLALSRFILVARRCLQKTGPA